MRVRFAILALLICVVPATLLAQQVPAPSGIAPVQRTPAAGGRTESIGQPGSLSWSVGTGLGISDLANETAGIGEFRINLYGEAFSGTLGAGGWLAEQYNRFLNAEYSAGMRLGWKSQLTGFAGGADYNFMESVFRGIFSYSYPLRRGGLFLDGSMLRLDYITAPGRTFVISIDKPVRRRIAPGKARRLSDQARLPGNTRPTSSPIRDAPAGSGELAIALRRELATARVAAQNMQRLIVPWIDHTGSGRGADDRVQRRLDDLHHRIAAGGGLNADVETERFHDALDSAFTLALIADSVPVKDVAEAGRKINLEARKILLSEVLYPYNFLLGQVKDDDTTLGLDDLASGAFMTWLHTKSGLTVKQHDATALVFDALLEMVEDARIVARRETGTSRFVWLPLQYGLRLEQRDTQEEVDTILAHATSQRFSAENHVEYVINEQFQNHLRRTILAARRYHVLWTHDFRGNNSERAPDMVGFQHVLHSYYPALTAAVRDYDRTGRFPTYIILLDQWFYEVNNGRRWMNVLEDPTRYEVHLPSRFSAMEDSLRAARDTLRSAIDSSALLTEHQRLYGDKWLRNLVKVHVNITNPPDPSFWSWRLVTHFPMPDGWMRDHRKIVFYDLDEATPYSGEAILTGAGIGEHYVKDWEDRSLLVCGPVALRLKSAARDLLMKQGMAASSIPAALQPFTSSTEKLPDCAQHDGKTAGVPALQLQNGTGFDNKEISVAKAVLYTLMPKGSVIKIPDSIWNGTFWGSALIGAALRGVQVMVIAPAFRNAPARAFGSMARSHELLRRFVMASRTLEADIQGTDGALRIGMFDSELPVTDIAARVRALARMMADDAWLRTLFPFAADSAGLARMSTYLDSVALANPAATGDTVARAAQDTVLLHLKVNFLASKPGWDVMKDSELLPAMQAYLQQRIVQVHENSLRPMDVTLTPDSTIDLREAALKLRRGGMDKSASERVMFYTVLGSANQNDRSMISDGEAAVVLSGWPAVNAYIDLLLLVSQSQWVNTPEELDRLLPAQRALKTRFSHWFKHIF